jgi:hypothetical protein
MRSIRFRCCWSCSRTRSPSQFLPEHSGHSGCISIPFLMMRSHLAGEIHDLCSMRMRKSDSNAPRATAIDGTVPLLRLSAFYAIDCVEISGASTEFIRTAESGRKVRMHFCPACGSTVYWLPDAAPSVIGVAVGLFADPAFAQPTLSVFEQSKHEWVFLDETMEHFPRLPEND